MKRAAFLVLFVGAPLALLFFPRLRRAIAARGRLLLLFYGAALLLMGGAQLLAETSRGPAETALALAGLLLLASAFALVLRDAVR